MVLAGDAYEAAELRSRWWRLVATSADVRSTLFASGVIPVEGDTELGLFGYWFGQLEDGQVSCYWNPDDPSCGTDSSVTSQPE